MTATPENVPPPAADPLFARPAGPLVAVCGLAGGAGTTTLAWLLATRAAEGTRAPILLAELDAASGGLAALAGTASARSLGRLALAAAGGDDTPAAGMPFATLPSGLRLIATPPVAPPDVNDDALGAALESGRAGHALTVVDCGVLRGAGAGAVLARATHVVWTVPAGPRVGEHVAAMLAPDGPAPAPSAATELLAVVAGRDAGRRTAGRALRDAAAERCERLVFVPADAGLADGAATPGDRRTWEAVDALLAAIAVPV